MNLFRRHRHEWGRWEIFELVFVDDWGRECGREHRQKRRCNTCGRFQRRRIGRI